MPIKQPQTLQSIQYSSVNTIDDVPLLSLNSNLLGSHQANLLQHPYLSIEQQKDYLQYLDQTINLTYIITSLFLKNDQISENLKNHKEFSQNFKLSCLQLNHRLRVSRVIGLLLLVALKEQMSQYISQMNHVDAQNTLHLLQKIVQEKSIIEQYSIRNDDKLNIDNQQQDDTKKKIKHILSKHLILSFEQLSSNKTIGIMLDQYFRQNSSISFDLLINALIIQYEIPLNSQESFANILQHIFSISKLKNKLNITVNEIMLFFDFISVPQLLNMIQNGFQSGLKMQDQLLKSLGSNAMRDYQLNQSDYPFTLKTDSGFIIQKLIFISIFSINSIKLKAQQVPAVGQIQSSVLKLKMSEVFQEKQMNQFLSLIDKVLLQDISQSGEGDISQLKQNNVQGVIRINSQEVQIFNKQFGDIDVSIDNQSNKFEIYKSFPFDEQTQSIQNAKFQENQDTKKQNKSSMTLDQACYVLSIQQTFQKQNFQELLDIELREKDFHAGVTLILESLTSEQQNYQYYSNYYGNQHLQNQNDHSIYDEESENENEQESSNFIKNERNDYQYADIISKIVHGLDQSNLAQEKLNLFRKLQKQHEKVKVLNEKIEQDTNGDDNIVNSLKDKFPNRQVMSNKNLRSNPIKSEYASQLSVVGAAVGGLLSHNTRFQNQMTSVNDEKFNNKLGSGQISSFAGKKQNIAQQKREEEFQIQQRLQNDMHMHILTLKEHSKTHQNSIAKLQNKKSELLLNIEHLESLLYKADLHYLSQRQNFIKSMRFFDQQVDLKEESIRNLLGEIAQKEMQKNRIQDELEEHTLRTIEVINISDIRIERDNLEIHLTELRRKECDLIKIENEYEKEKEKMDEKKRKRLGRK
eukprot:403365558